MSRLWAVLVGLLATLTMAGVAPTTTARAASFVYDAPALARVDAHASGLAEAGQRAPIGAQEGSVSPSVEARGTATTSPTRSIATEAESGAMSCSVNSFTGDTSVVRGDGTLVAISAVKVGDTVLATDPDTGRTVAEPIDNVIVHGGKHTMVDV